jgi:hypothetical protein
VAVAPIALKGAALVAHGVVEPGERHMHDVDLLIPPSRAEAALAALLEYGFTAPQQQDLPGVDGRHRAESRWRDPHIAFHAVGPYGTPLEVHVVASRISGGTWNELAPLSVPVLMEDVSVLVPTVHRLRRMLSEHVFVSHLADPRLMLRHAADLAALERWAASRVARPQRSIRSAEQVAERALMRLVCARETERSPVTAAQRLLLSRDGGNATRVEQVWHVLEAMEVVWYDLRHRPGLLLRRVFPHPAYLAALYGLPLEEAGELRTHLRRWRELRTGLGGSRRRQ